MFDWMTGLEGWIALLTLTVLEIVLGIDNIVFISILAGKLRKEERERARRWGLSLAMITRLGLLAITWVMGLTARFHHPEQRDLGPRPDPAGRRPVLIAKSTRDPRQAGRGGGRTPAAPQPRLPASSSRC